MEEYKVQFTLTQYLWYLDIDKIRFKVLVMQTPQKY